MAISFHLACASSLPFFLLARAANAEALSTEEAVREALAHHQVLEAASAKIAVAEGLRQQASLKPNPRLFLQSENARFGTPPPFLYGRDADSFIYLSQVIETAKKRALRTAAANEGVRLSEIFLAAQRSQIAGRVLTAYWAAAGAQRLEKSFHEGLENLGRAVQYHRDRVREGSLPEADLIRMELEYQQVSISFENARQDARRLLQLLFREMGEPVRANTVLSGNLDEVTSPALIANEEAIERRPDYQLAAEGTRQTRAVTALQRANAVPDPEVLLGYKRTSGLDTVIAGVQINLPIRNRNQGAIAAAAADEVSAAATLRATRIAAETEIEALRGEFDQKKDLVNRMLPPLRQQAAETSRIAQAVYREGASDLLRLIDAERTRLQAEALYIRSLIEYHQAAIALQIALGFVP